MPTRNAPWPAGTPCWVDNHVPDLDRARRFYEAVLGWQIDDPDPDAGNFAAARSSGRPVAGFLVAVEGAQPVWHVYVATDDMDATVAAIETHGGTSLFGPQPVPPDRGTFHLAADPLGATFGVWQAGSLTGTAVYAEPGSLGWTELRCAQPTAAQTFYPAVFDLHLVPQSGAGEDYALFHASDAAGSSRAGVSALSETVQGSYWLPYFVVANVDTALAAAKREGAEILAPARDTGSGRVGELADPFGAAFAVISPTQPASHR